VHRQHRFKFQSLAYRKEIEMAYAQKTAIVTGASQGIGAGLVDAIVYLTEAKQVTWEVLHVDGGAHVGKW
jgi:hypothetical protein